MGYDPSNLRRLGKRVTRLRADLDEAQRELVDEVRAALAADYPLRDVIADSGYTRDAIFKIRTGQRRNAEAGQ
jgi:hypothetical protein